jgi:hypothetical protein
MRNLPSNDEHVVPLGVANIAANLEDRLLEASDTPLAPMLERCSTTDVRSALEHWIMDQLDFDDPEIANAGYRVIERRLERQLFLKTM